MLAKGCDSTGEELQMGNQQMWLILLGRSSQGLFE